ISRAFVQRNTNFFRRTSSDTISSICGCISGSPPAMDTIGAPHSSTAATACSTGMRRFSTSAGCWILPQPAQARLQANSGSSSRSSGNFFLPRSLFLRMWVPIRMLWRSGMLTVLGPPSAGRSTPSPMCSPRGALHPASRRASCRTSHVAAQGADREDEPVEVVVDVEVAGEAGAGEVLLVPVAVRPLVVDEPADAGVHGGGPLPGGQQRQQRPGRLGRGGRAAPDPGRVVVGAHVLAPPAVVVLVRLQPRDGAADRGLLRADAGGDEGGHDAPGPVDVVGAPPPEPGSVGL